MNYDQNKRDYRPKNHIPRDYTPHPDDWEEKAKPPVPRMSVDG